MKKLFKFLFFFLLFILIVLFTAPILFKGKIIKIANEQINENINAKGSFEDISLSFFTHFPYLSAGIKQLTIEGINDFEGDTLVHIESFELAVNVVSAIKMENIEIKKIAIVNPEINALVLEDGKANWDIAKESEEVTEEVAEDTTETPSEFNANIALKSFEIKDADISYNDQSSGVSASLDDFDFELKGDFSKQFSTLLINSSADKLNLVMGGIRYLRDVALNIDINVDANLTENIFVLQKNSFALNDFVLTIDGKLEMPDSADMAIDMTYATSNTEFKTLLSLVPAIYLRDFSDLKTSGKLALNGSIKGTVGDETTPDVDGKLTVQDATFSYPDLPKNAENINIDVDYFVDGKQMDNTTVDVNKFHIELGNNPIDIVLNLRTPISDPFINTNINAKIDLSTMADLIPLDDTEIKGIIDTKLDLMGKMSQIENEEYEDFKAVGNILISDLYYSSPDVPKPVNISTIDFGFSPKYLSVNKFAAKLGKSDFELNGKVTNYLPYVLNDGTIKGELKLMVGTIDLNELMADETSSEEKDDDDASTTETTDTASMEVFEVPGNINFSLNSKINKLYYDNMEIDQVIGMIYIRDSKVVMEKLSMNMLEGNINLSGEYNTQDISNPLIDFDMQLTNIDIPKAFTTFELLGKVTPVASKATGKVTLGIGLSSFLDGSMKPILNSMVGEGNLSSKKIGIKGSTAFNSISKHLNTDAFKEMALNDLSVDFEIRGGKLFVEPFETKMGQSTLLISGEQGFDKTMDYGINFSVPKSLLGSANSTITSLAGDKGINLSGVDEINMLARVTGDMAKPNVKIDMKDAMKNTKEAVKKEIKQKAKQEIETRKEDAKVQARAEAAKVMAQAEAQAAQIRKEAKNAANQVRKEANNSADALVKEATNPFTKKAAEIAADKTRDEGEKRAKQIESEADKKANRVLSEAKSKSDQLLK